MENKERTEELFGYTIDSLSYKSKKRIALICDYCGCEYDAIKKNRENSRKVIEKDCCKKCKFKKREEISLKLYGVKNSAQRQEVRDILSQKTTFGTNEFEKKKRKTMVKKYGVENPMHSDSIKEKHKNVIMNKYGVDNVMKIPSVSKKAFENATKTKIDRGIINNHKGKTFPKIASEIGVSRSHFLKNTKEHGIESALKLEPHRSSLEIIFREWCISEGIEFSEQVKIGNKIADFVIGDVVVELDGLYWHSEINLEKNYHKNKMSHYKESGYRPLFFRENEIRDKFDIVTSIVKNAINKSSKIFARKCEARQVCKKEAKIFLRDNHLMGMGRGDSFGLYYNDILVSLLCVSRIRGENYDISRFCHKIGVSVTGGFSKLLKYFEKVKSPLSTRTFIDLRYGNGEYLTKFGFKEESCNLSFKWTDGENIFNRMVYPGALGYEYGMCKIWDCGQRKYMKYY